MNYIDRELKNAINNLASVSKTAVPRATAQAVNRVGARVVTHAVRETSKAIKVPQKVIKQRIKRVKAKAKRPVSYIKVKRGNIPAISIGSARTQVKRKKGRLLVSQAQRDKRGKYTKREHAGYTSIRVGRHVFTNAFLQKLKNGRWHIMQRTSDASYPIKVISIPLEAPITKAFKVHSNRLLTSDMPKELSAALHNQFRLVLKRTK